MFLNQKVHDISSIKEKTNRQLRFYYDCLFVFILSFSELLQCSSLENVGLSGWIEISGEGNAVTVEIGAYRRRAFVRAFYHADGDVCRNCDSLHHHAHCYVPLIV